MRWSVGVLGICLLIFSSLALAQKPVEISLWHTSEPPARETLEELIGQFNASQRDYRINPRFVGDLREGGIKLLAALRTNATPVIFQADISFLGQFAQENAILPLDDYLLGMPTDFYPGFLDAGKLKGKTYGLPFGFSIPVLFYNADQFKAKGLKAPTSWDDVARAAAALTTRAARGLAITTDIWSFAVVVMSRGGNIVDANGKPTFTDARVVESLEFLQKMVKAGQAQARNIAEAQYTLLDFLRTKVFMGLAPSPYWPAMELNSPIPFTLGVAPVPGIPGGKMPLTGPTFMVVRGATLEQVRGSVALWRYLIEPAPMARWTQATYNMPMRRSAQPLLEAWYQADPRRRVAFAQVENGGPWLRDPEAALWYGFLEEALERALKGGAVPRTVLEEAQRKALQVEPRK